MKASTLAASQFRVRITKPFAYRTPRRHRPPSQRAPAKAMHAPQRRPDLIFLLSAGAAKLAITASMGTSYRVSAALGSLRLTRIHFSISREIAPWRAVGIILRNYRNRGSPERLETLANTRRHWPASSALKLIFRNVFTMKHSLVQDPMHDIALLMPMRLGRIWICARDMRSAKCGTLANSQVVSDLATFKWKSQRVTFLYRRGKAPATLGVTQPLPGGCLKQNFNISVPKAASDGAMFTLEPILPPRQLAYAVLLTRVTAVRLNFEGKNLEIALKTPPNAVP